MTRRNKRLFYFFLFNISLLLYGLAILAVNYFSTKFGLSRFTDCISHMLFNIYCPFCGGTRALDALLSFDILRSLLLYPALIPFSAAFIYYDIKTFVLILRDEPKVIYIKKYVWISILVIIFIHWIAKNIISLCFGIDLLAK